ncbi:MAG: hypothetical protein ACK47M_21440, partial [Caldilinea sp.]
AFGGRRSRPPNLSLSSSLLMNSPPKDNIVQTGKYDPPNDASQANRQTMHNRCLGHVIIIRPSGVTSRSTNPSVTDAGLQAHHP